MQNRSKLGEAQRNEKNQPISGETKRNPGEIKTVIEKNSPKRTNVNYMLNFLNSRQCGLTLLVTTSAVCRSTHPCA